MAVAEGGIAKAVIVDVWLERLKALDQIKTIVVDCGTGAGNCEGWEGDEQELEGHVEFWFGEWWDYGIEWVWGGFMGI